MDSRRLGGVQHQGDAVSQAERGQASLEVLALVPILVLLALGAFAVASALAAASAAQDDARRRAMGATGGPGVTAVVTGVATMPAVPGIGWRPSPVRVRAAVVLP